MKKAHATGFRPDSLEERCRAGRRFQAVVLCRAQGDGFQRIEVENGHTAVFIAGDAPPLPFAQAAIHFFPAKQAPSRQGPFAKCGS